MPKQLEDIRTATAFDHDSTLVMALELSGKCWECGAVVPGLLRQPRRRLEPRDISGVLSAIAGWRSQAEAGGRKVHRIVLTYEAGRDGFWIAHALQAAGIEVHVMHPASIPMPRRSRRRKTDRIDLTLLLRTFLAWLRGEPQVCSMARIVSREEAELRQPGRERERLVIERGQLENRIDNLLCLHGIAGFKPRLKKACERLESLRCHDDSPLPRKTMAELRRAMVRHRLISEQLRELEAERDQVVTVAAPDRAERMIQLLARFYGLGIETATVLVREAFGFRSFRDRRALGSFVGVTGTPFQSGGMEREQGIDKSGNARIRRVLMQLAWRWVRFQPESAISRWFAARTSGAKGRIRKVMIVALARKLLVSLWRYLQTGAVPEGARLAAA